MKIEKDEIPVFPVRQDITVLEADEPRESQLGLLIYEYAGCPIYKYFKGWEEKYTEMCKHGSKYEIRSFGDICTNMKVIVPTFFGPCVAKVVKMDYKNKRGRAETENSSWLLEFASDDRGEWVATCHINKAALEKVRISL